jgi:curved DNA-binding protein CbpA
MSKPIVSINFNELKFNLYEVLGLTNEASESRIKKSFKKLVIEYHPDKNPDYNEEIFNHIVIANQVLSNTILRKDYDNYLEEKDNKTSHVDLKNNFESAIKDVEKLFPVKEEANKTFKTKIEELNKKHGVNDDLNSRNVMSQYEQLKKMRDSQISIPQEKISNRDDFNQKFESRKDIGAFDGQIIPVNPNSSLGTYQPNDALVGIGDYSKLYSEDSVSTGSYTSLDMAFKIQKIDSNVSEKSLKERMEEYKNQTNLYNARKPSDYSSKKFDDWTNSK